MNAFLYNMLKLSLANETGNNRIKMFILLLRIITNQVLFYFVLSQT
jgi:hypothetical protein